MKRTALLPLAVASLVGATAAPAQAGSTASAFLCERAHPLSATEQDRLLRFAAVVREELSASEGGVALVSRSGLDLSRFGIRYSHAAVAWRADSGAWSARQLYYACDESRPRIYDQGLAGFAMGIDDPSLGYVSIVTVPHAAAESLRRATVDAPRAVGLLAARYSANAHAFDLRYQNCNQWVAELLAVAWGGVPPGPGVRADAQRWLREADYRPSPVDVGSHALMFASVFMPLLHLDDHPEDDRLALRLRVSLPASLEAFVRQREPTSERVEICHNGRQVVVHRGWEPMAAGCVAGAGDRVVVLD